MRICREVRLLHADENASMSSERGNVGARPGRRGFAGAPRPSSAGERSHGARRDTSRRFGFEAVSAAFPRSSSSGVMSSSRRSPRSRAIRAAVSR
jgi:hypothetical protein